MAEHLGPSLGMYAARLLDHFGTPERAYYAASEEYDALTDLPPKLRQTLADKDLSEADAILACCEQKNISVLTCQDAAYPQRLAQLDTAPCVLYVRGKLPQIDQEAAVAIVGAREASPYGVMAARRMGLDLARQGALVISGSARGVDAAALQGLYEDVAAAGALVSEYPPGTPPNGPHFPVRNRLIAGLSLGVLVVEGKTTSGSLITARWALDQGRDVFAIPGGIDAPLSQGPNSLIRRGEAKLVQDAWDIVEEYQDLYPDKLRLRNPLPDRTTQARLGTILPPPAKPSPRQQEERDETPPQEERPARRVIDLSQEPESLTDDQAALLRALGDGQPCSADDLVKDADNTDKTVEVKADTEKANTYTSCCGLWATDSPARQMTWWSGRRSPPGGSCLP